MRLKCDQARRRHHARPGDVMDIWGSSGGVPRRIVRLRRVDSVVLLEAAHQEDPTLDLEDTRGFDAWMVEMHCGHSRLAFSDSLVGPHDARCIQCLFEKARKQKRKASRAARYDPGILPKSRELSANQVWRETVSERTQSAGISRALARVDEDAAAVERERADGFAALRLIRTPPDQSPMVRPIGRRRGRWIQKPWYEIPNDLLEEIGIRRENGQLRRAVWWSSVPVFVNSREIYG